MWTDVHMMQLDVFPAASTLSQLCGELLYILSLPVSPARLSVSLIDSCSQDSVYAARVLLVTLSSSGEGHGVIENRNAD